MSEQPEAAMVVEESTPVVAPKVSKAASKVSRVATPKAPRLTSLKRSVSKRVTPKRATPKNWLYLEPKKHVNKKVIRKEIITSEFIDREVPVNSEFKINLREKRFYAWEEDQTVIQVLKRNGWTYCGEPVLNGREDHPASMYDARSRGDIDVGPALYWADDNDARAMMGLSEYHLISSIPDSHKNLKKCKQQEMFNSFDWFPHCFTVPKELPLFRDYIVQHPDSYWICKPDDGYGGSRMCVFRAGSEEFIQKILNRKTNLAIQRYMTNPYLLAGLYKFHFRCYMVITNAADPLKAYLWKNSQLQFSTHPFDLTKIESNWDKYAHITNYKVNNEKKNKKFALENKPGIGIGTEWSFERFVKYMNENDPAFSPDKFWAQMTEIARVVATKLMTSKPVRNCLKRSVFQTNHFEVYGLDILMDENRNLAMTEANTQPGLDDSEHIQPEGERDVETIRLKEANDVTHGVIMDSLLLVMDEIDQDPNSSKLFSPFIPLL